MKRIICILASLLFLASCWETTIPEKFPCQLMTFSDALPVQFWLSDCNTYNETVPKGVHEKCFCAPWQCADEIKIQFFEEDTPDTDYALLIKNSDGDYLSALHFTEIEPGVHSVEFSPETETICDEVIALEIFDEADIALVDAPSDWLDDDVFGHSAFDTKGATSFTVAATAASLSTSAYQPAAVPVGTTITIPVTVVITGTWTGLVSITMQLTDNLGNSRSTDLTVDPTDFSANGTYTIDHILEGITGTSVRLYLYFNEFITSGTANVTITIPVNDILYVSGDSAIAKSDCLDIATVQDETELIEYSNERNFAGLKYQNTSPDPSFALRVPCRFFHQEFPEEDEAMELTSSVITTSSQLKTQRLLEVKHVPYYFHKKLQLVLKHQTLTINTIAYKKEEKYEINKGNPRWPLKSATCLLTERNSVLRNVL